MDLSEFLLARIDEDEAEARAAMPIGARRNGKMTVRRRLAESDTKRRIVELHSVDTRSFAPECNGCSEGCQWCEGEHPWPCPTLRLLALPYADHPDYRQEWAP